ncbi:cell cycle regulator of non-homologous end joining [Erythrolamprus reginae]|uniref:cell cycle regulator of non-homologous end joining n=1 Tax=Erythrolamprus reginae TaxID=121349 RepID=UPI00396C890C
MSSPEAAKKRILPGWMTKNVPEPEEWAKMRPKRRKKTALARTETVYCMNEAELVDMALCILAENCKAIEGDEISSEDKVHQQESIDGHLPRTAVNIAKDPPVPSTPSDQSASLSSNEETKLEEYDGDDALKYVREIFFT